jgi:hypothetical protein
MELINFSGKINDVEFENGWMGKGSVGVWIITDKGQKVKLENELAAKLIVESLKDYELFLKRSGNQKYWRLIGVKK